MRHGACRRRHIARGQQRLTSRHQKFDALVVPVRQLVVQFLQRVQRVIVQVGGALVGQPRHRLVRGAPAVLDGFECVSRPGTFEVVVGQVGQQFVIGARHCLQRRRDALVQPHAPHGRQLGKQRLPDDGMVEAVAAARFLDDDGGLACLVECVDQVLADYLFDQVQGELAAHHRGRGQCLVRLDREPGKPAAHGFPDALWQGARVPVSAALVHMTQGLDEEERVASGDRCQRAGQLFVVVSGLGHIRADVVHIEAVEGNAVGAAVTVEVGEHRRQRVGAIEVRTAVGADDLHASVLSEAQKVAEQKQSGLGRPVQVVEYQDDGCIPRGDSEQRHDGIEQCVAFGVRVSVRWRGEIGENIGQPGHQRQ